MNPVNRAHQTRTHVRMHARTSSVYTNTYALNVAEHFPSVQGKQDTRTKCIVVVSVGLPARLTYRKKCRLSTFT